MARIVKWIGLRLAFIVLVSAGCTRPYIEYPGPPRPEGDIAVIMPADGVKIHALDSRVINVKADSARDWLKYNRIELRAGEYTLTLIPQAIATAKSFTRLAVKVEAGQRYRVRSQFYPEAPKVPAHYKFWVENARSGEVVSAIAESQNPFRPRD